MNKVKKLAGETLLYGLGNIVPRLLNFLLFPIHTKFFAPEEYGVLTYLMSFVGLLNVVYSFGMETAFFRFASKPGADQNKVFNVAQTVVVTISAVLTLLFIVTADSLSALLDAQGHGDYIIWLAIIMLIDNIVSIPFARLRLERKTIQFTFFRIANVIILTGLNFYFLYFSFDPAFGIGYIFIANLIANAFYLVFFLKTFLNWRPAFDKEMTTAMTHYAYPIMLTGLAGMMNEFFSRISLERWLPEDFYRGRTSEYAVGVFGACYKFSVLMNLTVQAFRMAGEPFFFSQASDRNSPQLFARINHYFIIVCCLIMLTVAINTDILKYVFLQREDYWEGLVVVPPLLLGYLFLGVYYNLTVWFKLTDKTVYGTIITVAAAVLTVVLNLILIPAAGYLGSSWATALVYGFMMVVCYLLGQKYYPIPYKVVSGLAYVTVTYLLIYAVNSIEISDQVTASAFHALVVIVFTVVVVLIEKKGWKSEYKHHGHS